MVAHASATTSVYDSRVVWEALPARGRSPRTCSINFNFSCILLSGLRPSAPVPLFVGTPGGSRLSKMLKRDVCVVQCT